MLNHQPANYLQTVPRQMEIKTDSLSSLWHSNAWCNWRLWMALVWPRAATQSLQYITTWRTAIEYSSSCTSWIQTSWLWTGTRTQCPSWWWGTGVPVRSRSLLAHAASLSRACPCLRWCTAARRGTPRMRSKWSTCSSGCASQF